MAKRYALFDILQWLSDDVGRAFLAAARVRRVPARGTIYEQSEEGNEMFRLVSGSVRLSVMNELIGRVFGFQARVFSQNSDLYAKLARDGQSPKALMISCADSRIVPEFIVQAAPGDLFVCRNAGNIIPPFSQANGGVSSTVEYAVVALGVRDIIVCGHSDCGAMKALVNPASLDAMPNVAAWRGSRRANRHSCRCHAAYR